MQDDEDRNHEAGVSRSGSRAIGPILALPAPIPNQATGVPLPTATTRSRMPRTFQVPNRRLDTNSGLRASQTATTGAVAPIANVTETSRQAKAPGDMP